MSSSSLKKAAQAVALKLDISYLVRGFSSFVTRPFGKRSNRGIVENFYLYDNSAHATPRVFTALIEAVDALPSLRRTDFQIGPHALNAVANIFVAHAQNPAMRAVFDRAAEPLTRKAARWLAYERDGFHWAAENYFVKTMPLMNGAQRENAVDFIAARLDRLKADRDSLAAARRRDPAETYLPEEEKLQSKIKTFDEFVRRLSPPTPRP